MVKRLTNLENQQKLLSCTLTLDGGHNVGRHLVLHTSGKRTVLAELELGDSLVGHKAGESLGDDVHDPLVVGEPQTLKQNLADKLGLGLLRVLTQGLVPVLPAPTELTKVKQ